MRRGKDVAPEPTTQSRKRWIAVPGNRAANRAFSSGESKVNWRERLIIRQGPTLFTNPRTAVPSASTPLSRIIASLLVLSVLLFLFDWQSSYARFVRSDFMKRRRMALTVQCAEMLTYRAFRHEAYQQKAGRAPRKAICAAGRIMARPHRSIQAPTVGRATEPASPSRQHDRQRSKFVKKR
jgi:hypothetical protein